jgi:hypothetical protein
LFFFGHRKLAATLTTLTIGKVSRQLASNTGC